LSLQLNLENLFDEDYLPAAHNDNNISVGAPLNARIGFSYQL
jgi:catecholate siderophore receptor